MAMERMALLGERNWWCPRFLRGRRDSTAPASHGHEDGHHDFPGLDGLDALARRADGDRPPSSAKLRR